MNQLNEVMLVRYLTGDHQKVCRLCFSDTLEDGVYLDEGRLIQCYYFDNSVTFYQMFDELGLCKDFDLPNILCTNCADATINAFLFLKLTQNATNKWYETIDKVNKTLDHCESIRLSAKTAYLIIGDPKNQVLTSRIIQQPRTKLKALSRIKHILLRTKQINRRIKKSLICSDECGLSFSSKTSLDRHIANEHSDRSYPCSQCPKIFHCQVRLDNHIERIHLTKTLQCDQCSSMFASQKLLNSHLTSHHKAVTCIYCNIEVPSRKVLKNHLKIHVTYKCRECNKQFTGSSALKYHEAICGKSRSDPKFICEHCNKSYHHKNNLKGHLATAHGFGKVYACGWCSKPFHAISRLNLHIVKHTRERNFHCDQCGGQFVTAAALTYHMRLHTGEKPFPCDMCDMRFLSASRRMEHRRRKHTGPDKECPVCHSKFLTKYELTKHVARHSNPSSKLYI